MPGQLARTVLKGPRRSNASGLPDSEAWFKTCKYAPTFPERFSSLEAARTFMSDFVNHHNHHHRHTGTGLHTPGDVHFGHANLTAAIRSDTLAAHPIRFTTTTDPKILALPDAAWINKPANPEAAAAEPDAVAAA